MRSTSLNTLPYKILSERWGEGINGTQWFRGKLSKEGLMHANDLDCAIVDQRGRSKVTERGVKNKLTKFIYFRGPSWTLRTKMSTHIAYDQKGEFTSTSSSALRPDYETKKLRLWQAQNSHMKLWHNHASFIWLLKLMLLVIKTDNCNFP